MTREEIIRIAEEAGIVVSGDGVFALCERVAAAERERCQIWHTNAVNAPYLAHYVADEVNRGELHECKLNSLHEGFGAAVSECWGLDDGTLWVGNGEYASQGNFCPVCGYKTKRLIEEAACE